MRTTLTVMLMALVFIMTGVFSEAPAADKTTLRMLVYEGYAPEELREVYINQVKDKYDLDVTLEVAYVSNPDDFPVAVRDGKADIISPSNHQPKDGGYKLISGRLTAPLDLSQIPNYSDLLPALQKAEYITEGGNVYGVPLVRGPYGLAYNTSIIKDEPTSWKILWDPKYKNNYTMAGDFTDVNVYLAALAAGYPADDIFDMRKVNTPEINQSLKELAENAYSFWTGVDNPAHLKGLALATTWGFSLPALRAMGENWKIANPDEGTTGWVDNFMIASLTSQDPLKMKAAYAWLDFALGTEYQQYTVRGLGCPPVTVSVNEHLTSAEIAEFHLDDPSYFAENIILWRPLSKATRAGFDAMWNKATASVMAAKIKSGEDQVRLADK